MLEASLEGQDPAFDFGITQSMQSATLCSPHRLSVNVRKLQTDPAMRKRYRSCSSVCVDVDKVASTCSPHLCVGFLFLILYLRLTTLSHTSLTHTIHTTLSHTTLSHTTLSPTIFHTQLCHTQLCHTPSFTHTTLSHTIVTHNFVTDNLLTHNLLALGGIHHHFVWQVWHLATSTLLCVAGVSLGDIHRHFAWQVWRFETSTFVLRGRGGTSGTGLALVARLGR